jgi:5-formyltetrahydrofolate cyclo-ligase
LAGLPPKTIRIGVCFPFQIVEEIPIEPHDERVHALVTGELA